MKVDAHQHYWDPARGDYGWLTPASPSLYRVFAPADLKPLREAAGVEHTVVVQAAPTVAETRYLLDMARYEASIAGVVGWIPLDAPDAPELIEAFAREPKFKGVRPMLQDLPDDDWIETARIEPAIKALIRHDLAFDALIFARHVPSFVRFAERYPELRIVVDHGAKPPVRDDTGTPDPAWAAGIAALAALPQKPFCKLSGLATEAAPGWTAETLQPYVWHLLENFGAARMMWGSDWPVLNLNGDYATWHAAAVTLTGALDDASRAALFGGAARAFYRL